MGLNSWFRVGGLIVAGVGFAVTRVFVAASLSRDAGFLYFVAADLTPLVVGLALTVYGIVLSIGPYTSKYANRVAKWCLVGFFGMTGVVMASVLTSQLTPHPGGGNHRFQVLLANVVLAGAVGGVLIGVRSASNIRHRKEVKRQANRGVLLNRLLRHEVVNAATVVRGHASIIKNGSETSGEALRDAAEKIDETVDLVGDLTDESPLSSLDATRTLDDAVEGFSDGETEVEILGPNGAEEVFVHADERLCFVFREILEYMVSMSEKNQVRLSVENESRYAEFRFSYEGPEIPEELRDVLEKSKLPDFDNPNFGFGLQIARLLVSRYNGKIKVDSTDVETVTLRLPFSERNGPLTSVVSVTVGGIERATVAGFSGGVAMGLYFRYVTETLPVIGALYGVEDPVVGWITHLFHSVVFGLVFVAVVASPSVYRRRLSSTEIVGSAVAWGVLLWFFAAGIVMPIWLDLVGRGGSLPTLSFTGLVSHILYGVTLGSVYVATEAFEW
ncbi:MAG: sensor histidine kinase [Halobacteria archaeon]